MVNGKLGDGLGSELIGISIDEYSNMGVDKLKEFIDGEKLKIEHILSNENMKTMDVAEENIDFVVVELKDLLSKVEIADRVFRECKYSNENLKDFLWNEYCRDKDIIENESEIKKGLYVVAKTLIELMRESENFEQDFLIQISNAVDDTNVELQKICDYMHENYGSMNEEIQMILVIVQMILEQVQKNGIEKQNTQKKIKSRTKEYADKWEANMFLNNFDKRDENAGVNVKLSEVYLDKHLPHYIWKCNFKPFNDLKIFLAERIYGDNYCNQMLLVLGQPGIGKTTLITWMIANFSSKIDSILVYQFASDLKEVRWENISSGHSILSDIFKVLGILHEELDDKTIILDGFDELSVTNDRAEILNQLNWELKKDYSFINFSLIILCRENYIHKLDKIECDYITLQPWGHKQIRSFCHVFCEKTKNNVSENTVNKMLEKKEIFGIPLILYLVLSLNIAIEEEGSIIDIYDKIFSLEDGGIYDRCLQNKRYEVPHRISDIKYQIHQISRDIAIWMFENEPDEASIPQEEYQKICINVMQENKQENQYLAQDFMIGGYFKLIRHCEGIETEELYFVHRTIYEYFVAETIYDSIENAMNEFSDESQEELAGNIAIYLKEGKITHVIGEYLKCKLFAFYNLLNNNRKRKFIEWWEQAIARMLEHGMFYYLHNVRVFDNIITKELMCFRNIIYILTLIEEIYEVKDYMLEKKKKYLQKYIKLYSIIDDFYNKNGKKRLAYLKLKKADLSTCDFKYIFLDGVDLSATNLIQSDFRSAVLSNTILVNAVFGQTDLSGANLMGADCRYIDFKDTNLSSANLVGANLTCADLTGAYLTDITLMDAILKGMLITDKQADYLGKRYNLEGVNIYITRSGDVVDYKKYCYEVV